jgi:hypothetical protein
MHVQLALLDAGLPDSGYGQQCMGCPTQAMDNNVWVARLGLWTTLLVYAQSYIKLINSQQT